MDCIETRAAIDELFESGDSEVFDRVQAHAEGCHDCRTYYAKRYATASSRGIAPLPENALLRTVQGNTTSPSPKLPPMDSEALPGGTASTIGTGWWLSSVLAALAVALLILLVQGPPKSQSGTGPTMTSGGPLTVDLYCVSDAVKRYILPFKGACDSTLELEYRNRERNNILLSIIIGTEAGERGAPRTEIWLRNKMLPSGSAGVIPLTRLGQPTGFRTLVALLHRSEMVDAQLISRAEAQEPSGYAGTEEVLIRRWFVSQRGRRTR